MKSNKPIFKNTGELAEVLDTLRKTSPKKRKDLPKLKDTTSLFDLFQRPSGGQKQGRGRRPCEAKQAALRSR